MHPDGSMSSWRSIDKQDMGVWYLYDLMQTYNYFGCKGHLTSNIKIVQRIISHIKYIYHIEFNLYAKWKILPR